jgi:hypothetical protein
VKPLPQGHASWRVGRDFKFAWFQHFTDALTDPMVQRPDFHEHVRAEHERGCAVLTYFFPSSMNADSPDCRAYKNEWGHPSDLPDVRPNATCYPPEMKMLLDSSWTDYFMAGLDRLARDYGIDGVYYDTSNPFRRSELDEQGTRYTFWPIFACRDFQRRTATIFERRRGQGRYVLMMHMSDNMVMPTLSFATLAFDGEQYNGALPDGVADCTSFLPLDRAEVINNPEHWGFPCMFLPELPFGWSAEGRARYRQATDSLFALILPLGNSWWDASADYRRQEEVAAAMAAFGTADAEFHPYWRQKEIQAPDGILVSYYERNNRHLLIVANPGAAPPGVTLALADSGFVQCTDALEGAALPVANGRLPVTVPARGFRVLVLSR